MSFKIERVWNEALYENTIVQYKGYSLRDVDFKSIEDKRWTREEKEIMKKNNFQHYGWLNDTVNLCQQNVFKVTFPEKTLFCNMYQNHLIINNFVCYQ